MPPFFHVGGADKSSNGMNYLIALWTLESHSWPLDEQWVSQHLSKLITTSK